MMSSNPNANIALCQLEISLAIELQYGIRVLVLSETSKLFQLNISV